jgi:hypothetical protein
MKLALCGLLALMRASALDGDPEPVAIFSEFDREAPPEVLSALRSELDAIMEPAGYQFEWHALKEADGHTAYPELVVVSFKGDCQAAGLSGAAEPGALGWTHRSGGELLPFTSVDCDRIQRLMSRPLMSTDPRERNHTLGRAVGRVLAHELYHILGKTSGHGAGGVAKPYYSPRELTAETFHFDESDRKLLRKRRLQVTGGAEAKTASR